MFKLKKKKKRQGEGDLFWTEESGTRCSKARQTIGPQASRPGTSGPDPVSPAPAFTNMGPAGSDLLPPSVGHWNRSEGHPEKSPVHHLLGLWATLAECHLPAPHPS